MGRRGLALAALICGFAVVLSSQRLAPIAGPPLYDGVVVEDTYKWLAPPPGYSGGPQPVSASSPIQGGQSPNLGVGTPEQPPQAQVFAGQGFLVMPQGTTTITVSIQPVPPEAQPTDGVIAGNVYRFSLTNQSGEAISGQSNGGVTIVLRGPPDLPTATIERLANGKWTPQQTDPAGTPHMFSAVVTDFGDFALVAPQGWIPASPGPAVPLNAGPAAPGSTTAPAPAGSAPAPANSGPPVFLIVALLVVVVAFVAVGALVWRRSSRAAQMPPSRSGRSGRPVSGQNRRQPPRRRR